MIKCKLKFQCIKAYARLPRKIILLGYKNTSIKCFIEGFRLGVDCPPVKLEALVLGLYFTTNIQKLKKIIIVLN